MHSFSLVATVLGLVAVASQVNAHGHLIAPFCRNCENENTAIDSLNTPTDLNNVCRGAPPSSTVTKVGRQTTLQIKASAPHVGPCSVFVLDENLGNSIKVADKENCAAPNVDHSWTITFPSNVSGRKVLRWTWEGCHVQPCEHYEQCSDIMIADSGYSTAPTNNTDSNDNSKPVYTAPAPAPVTTPISYDIPITSKPAPAVPAPAAPVTAYSEDTTTSTPALPCPSLPQSLPQPIPMTLLLLLLLYYRSRIRIS
ncbi:hypothetical protein BDF19DRAFT_421475 [Syncephalis fuscata]|nr:hypothetical protein BDF19DRAFT_421475 [Syncephalis fuscata]